MIRAESVGRGEMPATFTTQAQAQAHEDANVSMMEQEHDPSPSWADDRSTDSSDENDAYDDYVLKEIQKELDAEIEEQYQEMMDAQQREIEDDLQRQLDEQLQTEMDQQLQQYYHSNLQFQFGEPCDRNSGDDMGSTSITYSTSTNNKRKHSHFKANFSINSGGDTTGSSEAATAPPIAKTMEDMEFLHQNLTMLGLKDPSAPIATDIATGSSVESINAQIDDIIAKYNKSTL